MRIYGDAYELVSELFREVWEMGHIVHPHSMQNKVVRDDPEFVTKEVTNYSYCLLTINKKDYLFLSDFRSKEWVEAEFEERVSGNYVNPGAAWTIRKDVWEQFLDKDGKFDYTYNERMSGQIISVANELMVNPDTRQAIISIWDPNIDHYNFGGRKRVPCSIYYQFIVRNEKLHIIYNQRSADVVTHFGNDVYLAWKLKDYMASIVGIKPGYLYHNIASLHSYKKDWNTLKTCIADIRSKING